MFADLKYSQPYFVDCFAAELSMKVDSQVKITNSLSQLSTATRYSHWLLLSAPCLHFASISLTGNVRLVCRMWC